MLDAELPFRPSAHWPGHKGASVDDVPWCPQVEEDTARAHTNAAAAVNASGSHIAVADVASGVRVFATGRAARIAAAAAAAAAASSAAGGGGAAPSAASALALPAPAIDTSVAAGEVASLQLVDKCAAPVTACHFALCC
jgi:hypothetical protein